VHPIVQRRPELEPFGIGQHPEHTGQRILAGTCDQNGRGRTKQDDVAQALQRMRSPRLVDIARLLPALTMTGVARAEGDGDAPRDRQRGLTEPGGRGLGQQGRGVGRRHIVVGRDLGADLVGENEARRGGRCLGAAAGGVAQDWRRRFEPENLSGGHAGAGGKGPAVTPRQRLGVGIAVRHSRGAEQRLVPRVYGSGVGRCIDDKRLR
jgi:hypothetical protein